MSFPLSLRSLAFAHADGTEQAEMLNSMGRELFVSCRGDRGFEMQCCFLTQKLNNDGIALIERLSEFVKLRKEEIR